MTKPLLTKKTELTKPSVTKPSLLWLTKSETTKTPSPLWNPASPITKTSYNKPKSIWPKPKTITPKSSNPSKPVPLKEKENIKLGLMKTTNHPSKSPPWKKELN